MKSDQINELTTALAKAQGEMKSASKDSTNPHYKSKYADLASVWDAVRGPLSKYGLAVIQTSETTPDGTIIHTMLAHSSGQFISGSMGLILQRNDMQGLGSAVTYARRYSLAAICGMAQDDDDGQAAVTRPIVADEPGPQDGVIKPRLQGYKEPTENYIIPGHMGKLAQKHPEDCDVKELASEVKRIEDKYKGKIMPAAAKKFVDHCSEVIGNFENFIPEVTK